MQEDSEPSRFFDRAVKYVERPAWLDALTAAVSPLQKSTESGDVVIVVTDPDNDLKLSGFLVCGGGRLVYEFHGDVPISQEKAFWAFASSNYLWVTPSIKLRKAVAAEVGGKAEGQSFKMTSDAMPVLDFIGSVAGVEVVRPKAIEVSELAVGENMSMF